AMNACYSVASIATVPPTRVTSRATAAAVTSGCRGMAEVGDTTAWVLPT
ncbi:MAG: hypothetical protein RLZZ32_797, partial [Cyanobacteriota bacterium]